MKIKLSNCVVKDWTDAQRPFVMEIRRALGRPHYLQAENESGTHAFIRGHGHAIFGSVDRNLNDSSK